MKGRTPTKNPVEGRSAFATAIKNAREAVGLSQTALAEIMETSQSTVTDWERGRTYPRPNKLRALDEALQANVSSLILGEGGALPPPSNGRRVTPRWQVAECAASNREAREALLATGWEPFAVVGETMWLKRHA